MQIEVSKQDLLQTLKFVSTATASADDLSGHYLFRVAPSTTDTVEVLAYDGHLTASARLTCKYTASEDNVTAFTFEARRLNMWLSAIPDGVVVLDHKGGTTTAFSPIDNLKFESLDANRFPYWDSTLAAATTTVRVKADRLKSLLQYARPFVSTDETRSPALCQASFRDNLLTATDTATAIAVKLEGFDKANFSVNNKNIASLIAFLGHCGDGEVEVCEHDNTVFYRLGNLAIFGESRMNNQFPKIALGLDVPNQHVWKLDATEVLSRLNFLLAGAPKDHEHLIFQPDADPAAVKLGMAVAAGGTKFLKIGCAEKVRTEGAPDLPEKGFKVRYPNLQKVLSALDSKDISLGINAKGSGGWIRVDEKVGNDHFYAILQWSI